MKLNHFGSIKLLALICLMPIIFSSNINAFPLTGSNGLVNATVFGVITNNAIGSNNEKYAAISVDVACDMSNFGAVLVDDDDNFYEASDINNIDVQVRGLPKQGSPDIEGYTQTREVIGFIVPEGTAIKKLRIAPKRNHASAKSNLLPDSYLIPISIDWNGIPEIKDNYTSIKLTSSMHNLENSERSQLIIWHNTIKITNNDSSPLEFRYGDMIFEDQYGWYYQGSGKYYEDETITLLPGESITTLVNIRGVSPLSRLIKLMYENLSMDISAWT